MAHKFRTLLKDIYVPFKCDYCKKPINDSQRFVRLDTFNLIHRNTMLSEYVQQDFYHMDCWKGLMNDMIQKKFKQASVQMAGIVKTMLPKIKGMLTQEEDGR